MKPSHPSIIPEDVFRIRQASKQGMALTAQLRAAAALHAQMSAADLDSYLDQIEAVFAQIVSMAAKMATPRPELEAIDGVPKTLLLVEDDEELRHLLVGTLKQQGFGVLAAGDGMEAFAVAQNHGQGIDLVVTDLVMPRLGGADLVKKLGEMMPDLVVLYISGFSGDSLRGHDAPGANIHYLQKPFMPEDLVAKVRGVLNPASPIDGDGATHWR